MLSLSRSILRLEGRHKKTWFCASAVRRPVRPADVEKYAALSVPSLSPDGKRVVFSVRRANIKDDCYDSDLYMSSMKSGETVQFTTGKRDQDPQWSPDGRSILFVSKRGFTKEEKGSALYSIPASGGEARQLLKRAEGVDGPQWGPDSKTIYFMSPVVKKEKDDVKVIRRLTFWFNGMGFTYNGRMHLFSVTAEGGKPVQLTRGGFSVNDFAVSNDGKRVAYLASADDSRPYITDLFVLDLGSKRTRRVTRSNMALAAVAWSPDGSRLAVAGNDLRSGFASHDRIWVTGASKGGLTMMDQVDRNKGNSLNSDVRAKAHAPGNLAWREEGIYYVQGDGADVHLYRTRPGGAPELVLGGARSIEAYDVVKGSIAFVAMDQTHPEEVYARSPKERRLTALNEPHLKELDIVPSERFAFRASDGETIEGWVTLPRKRSKKVPVVLYVHGGPKTAFGSAYVHEFQAFAAAGYGVVYMNPRGSDGYSESFADIRGRYGTRDYDDLLEGLDHALKAHPALDGGRVAIAGGSYGGFMTNWAVGHTDRFRAAVTDRSIANWMSFWGTSDIGPYFTRDQIGGDPWNAEEKLLNDSPIRYVQNVKTPLLIVHSMEDYRCWMVEGLEFFTALKSLGKEAELVLFPGENHDLSRVGKPKHRVARLNHYIRWFDTHLKQRS